MTTPRSSYTRPDDMRAWLNSQPDGTVLRNRNGEIFTRRWGTWWEAVTETGPGRIEATSGQLQVIYSPRESTTCAGDHENLTHSKS